MFPSVRPCISVSILWVLTTIAVKNVYALFAYQNRHDGEVYDPYVQLMPITNVEDAHHDWEVWYEKWVGASPHPSSYVSSSVKPTPTYTSLPSSHSTPYSTLPSSHSTPYSTPTYTSSSATDPLATNHIAGAVENDGGNEVEGNSKKTKSKGVRSLLFPSLIPARLTCLLGGTILGWHCRCGGHYRSSRHRLYRLRCDEVAKGSRRQGFLPWPWKAGRRLRSRQGSSL